MKTNWLLAIILAGISLMIVNYMFSIPATTTVHILQEGTPSGEVSFKFFAMALAVCIPAIGASYAVAKTGSSAIASTTEKPELFGKAVIFVGLAEGIAIYGLLTAFLIWIS